MKSNWAAGTIISTFLIPALLALPAPQRSHEMRARLLTPLASYSRTGTAFELRVTGPVNASLDMTLPTGTIIYGNVRKAHSIGLGLRRERAVLELEFSGCELPNGEALACEVKLNAIDNAREIISKPNQIQGILAASHPHSWLSGIWFRPDAAFFHRAAAGLTGAGGMIYTRVAPGPAGAAIIIASRLLLFRMPNPEIELPAGTELLLQVKAFAVPAFESESVDDGEMFSEDLIQALRHAPSEIGLPDRVAASDIINVAFVGDKADVVRAFEAAGWTPAEPLNARTLARTYAAFSSMKTYSQAPVSRLYYRGRLPDLVFQSSFNTLAKRHHVRLWWVDTPGQQFWLGAATHDVSIGFDWNRLAPTHRIDPSIDREQSKVMSDLAESGCVASKIAIERPELARQPNGGDSAVTDGTLVAASLQRCYPRALGPALQRPRTPFPAMAARRLILETRHYLTRGNAYYWAYRTTRWGLSSKRWTRSVDD